MEKKERTDLRDFVDSGEELVVGICRRADFPPAHIRLAGIPWT